MKVEILPFDPSWSIKYNQEAKKIKSICSDNILTIEHAGSTSIDNLASKPVIDIYIGTKSIYNADKIIEDFINMGYVYVKEYENELPFRRFFRKDINGKREFNVHITEADHEFRNSDLMFKDYLILNENVKKDYENLKLKLSKYEWNNVNDYTEAKSSFCSRVKQEALNYFSKLYEKTESIATYNMYNNATEEASKKANFKLFRNNLLTAIKSEIFPGFSLNRVMGLKYIDEDILDTADKFYEGLSGKFALQIPPNALNEKSRLLLNSRDYKYANSWVTFYRNTEPIKTNGTEFKIQEIGKEYALKFGKMLNEVFSFPSEFDEISASVVGSANWYTYMAFDKDRPVGAASIYIDGDFAFLAFANVLPEYRNKGLQHELLKIRIDTARNNRVKWVFLNTADSLPEKPNPSYWNVLRCGFRLLYRRPNFIKVL
jgi:GrpB-like predicted nucleotidyltransferase (UPF0157 family)/GNAT superfamily N-acetyltransferase